MKREINPELIETLNIMRQSICEIATKHQKNFEKLTKQLNNSFCTHRETIQSISNVFTKNQTKFISINETYFQTFAERGWFIDPDDIDISSRLFQDLIDENIEMKPQKLDKEFIKYFEDNLDEIKAFLNTHYGNRKYFFERIFKAIKDEDYIVSVPLCLMQVDGIMGDIFGYDFFSNKNQFKNKQIASIWLHRIFIDVLVNSSFPINQSQKQRTEPFEALNRHMILHGEDINYGNKKYAFQAISILY